MSGVIVQLIAEDERYTSSVILCGQSDSCLLWELIRKSFVAFSNVEVNVLEEGE